MKLAIKDHSDTLIKLIFFLPFVIAFFLYAWTFTSHGFAGSDDGFILSLAYRIASGEVPHRDFIYVRPAGSLFLHTVWFFLPWPSAFFSARIGYVLWMLAIAIVPAWIVCRSQKLSTWTTAGFALSAISGLTFSMHNFPPMPWHTIDGALFSALGIGTLYLAMERRSALFLFITGVCVSCAVLCKQGYFLIPLFVFASLFATNFSSKTKHRSFFVQKLLPVGLGGLAPLIVLGTYLAWNGALHQSLFQLQQVSNKSALFSALFEPYLISAAPVFVAISALLYFFFRKAWLSDFVIALFLAGISGLWLWHLPHANWLETSRGVYFFLAGIIICRVVDDLLKRRGFSKFHVYLLGSVVVPLSAQVSWGYVFPILGMALTFPAVFLALATGKTPRFPKLASPLFAGALITLLFVSWRGLSLVSYGESSYSHHTHNLGEIYPRFGSRLMTNPGNHARILGLKTIYEELRVQRPEARFVSFPSQPLFYYLNGIHNPAGIDWWLPQEYPNMKARLSADLHKPNTIILFEFSDTKCQLPLESDPLENEILASFRKIHQSGNYCAYEALN